MKKTLFSAIASALVLVLVSNTANAQSIGRYAYAKTLSNLTSTDSKEVDVPTTEAPASAISEKVTRSFSKSFNGAAPKWFMVNGNYLARFTANGNVTHALYKKNGYMLYSVTKGAASLLPQAVSKLIQDQYEDYEITGATQAVSLGTTAWIADLKLGHILTIVKVIDGQIVEATRYRTQAK